MNQLLRLTVLLLCCWLLSVSAAGLSLLSPPASALAAHQSAERAKTVAASLTNAEMTNDGLTTDGLTTAEMTNDGLTTGGLPTAEMTNDGLTNDGLTNAEMTNDGLTTDPILLREGTVITLELYETVSSKNRRAGDLVQMGVFKACMVGGQTLIKEGAYAEGKVVMAQRRGVFGRPGRIVVSAVNVEAVDNQRIALIGQQMDPPGDDRRMLAWGGSVILTLVGIIVLVTTGGPPALALPLLLFGLLVSGREVEIPAKTKVQAVVKYDTLINP